MAVSCNFMPRSVLALCSSHFLSTWGDRMWSYAVAIFLVEIGCGSLLLPAIFGLVLAAVNFLGSTLVGKWVDNVSRMRVIRVSLFVQNLLVTLCAVFLILLLQHQSGSFSIHDVTYYTLLVLVIVFSAGANLIGQATTIALERDWVVVISDNQAEILAKTNAIMRRIDLLNKIIAPLPVSFLMTKSVNGLINGAIFIAAWNVASGIVEYVLLVYVYGLVPALASKSPLSSDSDKTASEREALTADPEADGDDITHDVTNDVTNDVGDSAVGGIGDASNGVTVATHKSRPSVVSQFFRLVLLPYTTVLSGWKVFKQQSVLRAGLSLALLYMTVLGFNGITNGFLYSQGLEVWQVSLCQSMGALFGILGTFIYQPIRRQFGLVTAGLIAIWAEAICLSLSAASVFLTGNPSSVEVQTGICSNSSTALNISTTTTTSTTSWATAMTSDAGNITSPSLSSDIITTMYSNMSTADGPASTTTSVLSPSLIFFLIGIVTARIGLWMFDLATTQLYQMEVAEEHRGTVGGVQSALNSNMDLLHFVLVIAFPNPQQFGGLVLASFGAVILAAILYSSFAANRRQQSSLCEVSPGHGCLPSCLSCCVDKQNSAGYHRAQDDIIAAVNDEAVNSMAGGDISAL